MIRPREETVEERHVEQPEGVDGIVESIGKVLVDVTIVVLLRATNEIKVPDEDPAGRDLVSNLGKVL
jgi:hypothetical protein